jgi:hypothetical protein
MRVKLARYREGHILQVPVVRCRQKESFEQMRDRSDQASGIIHVLNDLQTVHTRNWQNRFFKSSYPEPTSSLRAG